MGRQFRRLVFRVHAFIGLYLLGFLLISFTTGTLLLFSSELVLALRPGLWVRPTDGPKASYGQTYDSVKAAYPEAEIFVMQEAPRPWFGDQSYVNLGKRKGIVWTRQGTAEPIGVSYPLTAAPREFIRGLHVNYMLPGRLPRIAVSLLSVVLAVALISGLITYRRFWKGYARLPGGETDARMRAGIWHRLLAVWTAPFLALVALTAMVYLAADLGYEARYPQPAAVSERAERLPAGFDGKALDALLAGADAAHPGLVVTTLSLPGSPKAPVSLGGYDPEAGKLFGFVEMKIDPTDGRILADDGYATANGMGKIWPLVTAIHYGIVGGFATLVLWALFGVLSVALLIVAMRVYGARMRDHDAAGKTVHAGRSSLAVYLRGAGLMKWVVAAALAGAFAVALMKAI